MNKRGIPGIPYFGEDTQRIEKEIKDLEVSFSLEYKDLYTLIQNEKSENKIVVIEDKKGVWLTYLRDIKFNYRDSIVFIPYFVYDLFEIDEIYKSKYKGHIVETENGINLRFNYQLCKKELSIANNSFILYDFELNKKYKVSFNRFFEKETFDIDLLYNYYIESCVDYEDFFIFKHVEGYHLISRKVDKIKNYEKDLRMKYHLSDYIETDVNIYYRDVRNLSKDIYSIKIGAMLFDRPYWERLLDFESYLFCILREKDNIIPQNKRFLSDWQSLGEKKSIIKYGDKEVKLIFKDYWLDNSSVRKQIKTWSRV